MGMKYIINCFNYPYKGIVEEQKQTKFLIIAIFWLTVLSRKYDGIDISVRN